MKESYEIKVKDKSVKKLIKQIILLFCLFMFFIAFMLLVFSFILTFYLLIPFGILAVFSFVMGSIAHLISKDYVYTLTCDKLIIKNSSGGVIKQVANVNLDNIYRIDMQIQANAIKYTPLKRGITLITTDKNYAITPDDYMLALLTKNKEVI